MNLNKNNKNLNNISNDYSNNQKDQNNFIVVTPSSTSSTYMLFINLDSIFTLETKLKSILDKINKYQACDKECLDYISYFFNNAFYEEETKIFKHKHNKKNFSYNMKIEILCFFLCYDISFSIHFNQAAILLKSIFNIIHSNFLSFIYYVINLYQFSNNIDEKNSKIVKNLQNIIEQDLKINLAKQDMNEYNILQIITNNSKNINNYYKMIIDNLYGQNYVNNDNNIKFPQCLNNQIKIISQLKNNKLDYIISAFFFDAYRLLTNYDFNDLNNFFDIFLKRKKNIISEVNNNNEEKYKSNEKNNFVENTNEQNADSQNKIEKYLLPRMKRIYKYSLVLDLDETLISIKRDSKNNIKMNKNNLIPLMLRPGLIDFLHKMKQIFELILFSSGTNEYVTPIIKHIEKKEKFFEHILYRQHVTYEENGNFFKNLNLLNRNVKNILIVDNVFENFKNHKSNGICIKPFYGDALNDKNTLKVLGNILYKVRYDADITGDIRVSLAKEKKTALYSQIANNL
jgi:Dullard-like phosphatase family protein